MLELLIVTCLLISLALFRLTMSGNLLSRLLATKILCSGVILLCITVVATSAPELTSSIIQVVSILLALFVCFAALLTLKFYSARESVETDKMEFIERD